MKKLALVLLLVGALVPSAEAGIVTGDKVQILDYFSGSTNGGEFWANGPGTSDFYTFCIERDEYFNPGGTYFAEISDSAQFGGVGGPSPDPLDTKTAYLYSFFLANRGTMNIAQIDGIQLAIWRIEEEVDSSYSGLGSVAARSAADLYYANSAGATGFYGVEVMRLWSGYNPGTGEFSGAQQDMLVVPDGGTTLALLGCALIGLGALRRKFGA